MIPKLDWRRFLDEAERDGFVRDLSQALRGPGVLRLAHHGIDPELIAATFSGAHEIFNLTEAEKRTLRTRGTRDNRGWAPLGAERLAGNTEGPERREGFNIGLELPPGDLRVALAKPFRTATPWPQIPGFRDTMLAFYNAVLGLGLRLHEAIATDLGLPATYFAPAFKDPLATLRLVTYPPATGQENEIGAGAHTDFGSISLLLSDDEPGLQARLRSGEWVDLLPERDSLVLLVGDTMERWSNREYLATPHRVMPPPHRRYALVFYMDPAPQVPVTALPELGVGEAHPRTYEDYLLERLAATREMRYG